jgi:hypothetical protein
MQLFTSWTSFGHRTTIGSNAAKDRGGHQSDNNPGRRLSGGRGHQFVFQVSQDRENGGVEAGDSKEVCALFVHFSRNGE